MTNRVSISIDVPTLEQGESFYCQALGCELLNRSEGMSILQFDGIKIYLLEMSPDTHPIPGSEHVRSYKRHWTPVHLDFASDDLEASTALVKANGGNVEGGDSGDWGSIAYCSDPFGNGFDLIKE